MSGMKYKEIAEKYGVTINTVKSWKKRYNWCRDGTKKGAHKKEEKGAHKNKLNEEEKTEGSLLNDKQRLFCIYYIKCFNATKAYKKAYGCKEETARANASKLLANPNIKAEITKMKESRLNREMLSGDDIVQKFIDIAYADITDYVKFGQREVPVMGPFGPIYETDKESGEKVLVTKVINAVEFEESEEVDGSLIQEVSSGKDGAKLKLADKLKALNWLAEHMDLVTDEQKARIENIRVNTARIKGENMGETTEDDGFIEALKGEAMKVWQK